MRCLTLAASIVLLIIMSKPLQGQTLLVPSDEEYVGVELVIPRFDGSANVSSGTGAVFTTVRSPIQPNLSLQLQLPVSRWTSDDPETETAMGNVYVGVEKRNPKRSTRVEFGVWLPTANESKRSALAVGALSDVDRWESFFEETVSARIRVGYDRMRPTKAGIRLRFGPSVLIPTGDGEDVEVFLMYSAHFMRKDSVIELLGGITGRMWTTINNADLGRRTFHQLDLALMFQVEQLRLGGYLLIPLDESLIDIVDTVVGMQVGVAL